MKKTVFSICFIILCSQCFAQREAVKGWQLLDFKKDSFYGISLNQAYQFLAQKKLKSHPVVVAILDNGIDTNHEDLRKVLWNNPKEIPGNKIDDDKNGYTDDYHGWNFLGNADGRNVMTNGSEWIRVYWRYKSKYESVKINPDTLSKDEQYEYASWLKARSGVVGVGFSEGKLDTLKRYQQNVIFADSIIRKKSNKAEYSLAELAAFNPADENEKNIQDFLLAVFKRFEIADVKNGFVVDQIKNYVLSEERRAQGDKIPPENERKDISGDDDTDPSTKFYGNNDVEANDGMHGSHLAGIIGAVRNNGIGMDGIADNVQIMMVRTTPEGDEFDKDIAMGIRYAVDNGAKVINMSFGKSLSPDKKMIDDAVRYALRKNVLLIQGAGNSKRNINGFDNYPNPQFLFTDSLAPNWITVGASDCNGMAADFSNYGDKAVDIFAPGVAIYSTLPGNKYMSWDGTSMATPVVSGVAALLKSYFPTLTAIQIKKIIEQTAVMPSKQTIVPGTNDKAYMNKLCRSGGVVNALGAVKLAYSLTRKHSKTNHKHLSYKVRLVPATTQLF